MINNYLMLSSKYSSWLVRIFLLDVTLVTQEFSENVFHSPVDFAQILSYLTSSKLVERNKKIGLKRSAFCKFLNMS